MDTMRRLKMTSSFSVWCIFVLLFHVANYCHSVCVCVNLFFTCSVFVFFQLSINGDKEFLDNGHKVNPYNLSPVIAVAVKQSEASQEAGPLPVKVDLNKTCV